MSRAELPPLDATAADHTARVVASLRERISREGPLRFDRYWDIVLYEPGLGYYAAGATKLGAEGDFVTAPELGPVFARCWAEAFAALLAALDGTTAGSRAEILEVGAGSGAFAATCLERLAALGRRPGRYRILERSADLAARQRSRLAPLGSALGIPVLWLDRLPDEPWEGIVFANEVLDALAPRRIVLRGGRWYELHVGIDGAGALTWAPAPLPAELAATAAAIEASWDRRPTGDYVTELQPAVQPWIAAVSAALARGAVLLSDYGYGEREYFLPERADGTLVGHFRHRVLYDPFTHPGLVDLSVSVNFGAVRRAFEATGLGWAGCVPQVTFLLETGLEAEAEAALALPAAGRLARLNEIKRLTLPSQMGERFRVAAGVRGLELPLPGLPPRSWLSVS